MAVTSSPANARAIRFVLIVGASCRRYPGANITVPDGTDAHAFAVAKAIEITRGHSDWVTWSAGNRPIIFPGRIVQRIETEYLDRA